MMKYILTPAVVTLAGLFATGAIADNQSSDERKTFIITMHHEAFDPKELVVPADAKLKIIVKNTDESPIEFESAQLEREKIVQPGSEVAVLLNPLKPGSYSYLNDFNHASTGVITVK